MPVNAAIGAAVRAKDFHWIPDLPTRLAGTPETAAIWSEVSSTSGRAGSSDGCSCGLETLICGAPQAEQNATCSSIGCLHR